MNVLEGILEGAEYCSSPNYNDRPPNTEIDLIVIHFISLPPKNYNTELIKDFFLNKMDPEGNDYLESINALKVSPHFLITRKGLLIQFVPLHKRAWHAGISQFKGRENCNDYSIGIELEGCEDEKFEANQYKSLLLLLRLLLKKYQIPKSNIVGHSDIAPGRKIDPGPYFNWNLLRSSL